MNMQMTLAEMIENRYSDNHGTRRVRMRAVPFHSCRLFETEDLKAWGMTSGSMMWIVDYSPDTPSTVHAKCSVLIDHDTKEVASIIIDDPTTKFKTHSDMMNSIYACSRSHGKECCVSDGTKIWHMVEEFDTESHTMYISFN